MMSDELREALEVKGFAVGDVVEGTVTAMEHERVVVDLGYKYEGIIPTRDLSMLRGIEPELLVHLGESVRTVVTKIDDDAGIVLLSRRDVDSDSVWDVMQNHYDTEDAFDVVVHDVVKGGLVTDVGIRGFIPASHVDTRFVSNLDEFKGQTIKVKVTEIDRANHKLILSRKSVLTEVEFQHSAERISALVPGSVVEGTVARIADYGVFVDLGGVDGLVHVSELSWQHVVRPTDVVKPGDVVRVKILATDPDAGRVSLSLKQAQEDPWAVSVGHFHEGDIVDGVVRRVADFGAFVQLSPGVEGLVHVSQISHERVARPGEALKPGQTVKVKILSVEPERKRISLSIKQAVDGKEPSKTEVDRVLKNMGEAKGTGATIGDLFGDLFRQKG